MTTSESLTREQALAMMEALLIEYRKPEFQGKLRAVLQIDNDNGAANMKEFEQELREIREQVGTKFGYEASPAGVAKSAAAFSHELRTDPDIALKMREMEILLYPPMPGSADKKCNVEAYSTVEKSHCTPQKIPKGASIIPRPNRFWIVVGGGGKGGIVVRIGEGLHTTEFASRLATGAVVQELELIKDRLHYKKIQGDGPDYGWVSIFFKSSMLLQPSPNHPEKIQKGCL